VTHDSCNLFSDHVVCNSNSLLWIALIVADNANDLLAENTTRSVDFVDSHVEAGFELFTEGSKPTGHWPSKAKRDVGVSRR
jgi:hypothetical protein